MAGKRPTPFLDNALVLLIALRKKVKNFQDFLTCPESSHVRAPHIRSASEECWFAKGKLALKAA